MPLPRMTILLVGLTCWVLTLGSELRADQTYTLLDPARGVRFDRTFAGFDSQDDNRSVRLFDKEDGWGGAQADLGETDLSSLADAYVVVRFRAGRTHQTDSFTIELYDALGNSGKWSFLTHNLVPGKRLELVSRTPLRAPESGVNEFQKLNLKRITRFNLLGEYRSEEPFDIRFESVQLSTAAKPRPAYPGQAKSAAWRKVAQRRIERHRMSDLTLHVVDTEGNPVANSRVLVRQQRHAFGFGAAVQAWRLRDAAEENQAYRRQVAKLFNCATIENNLKWPTWEGEWNPQHYSQQGAQYALAWLQSQRIRPRGHVLVWPGKENLPRPMQQLVGRPRLDQAGQQQLRNEIAEHIAEMASATEKRIVTWDVVNEPRTNHDLMDRLDEGDEAMAHWFRLAREAMPEAKLALNEFGILASGGATDTSKQQLLERQLRSLLLANAPIDAIGLQSHFDTGLLTGPEQLWKILDRFATLGLDIHVTEFDFNTRNETLQADYVRDFLTAMFAHPAVSELTLWVFWEGGAWRPDAALFRKDWSLKPSGQAYLELVRTAWWTDESATTDAAGTARLRAFHGEHVVTVPGHEIVDQGHGVTIWVDPQEATPTETIVVR